MKSWRLVGGLTALALLVGVLVGVLFGTSARSEEVDIWHGEATTEFLNNYAEMRKEADPENILLVLGDLEGDWGAERVVRTPDGAYFLQYATAEQREAGLVALREAGVRVGRNHKSEVMGYMSWGIKAMGLDAAAAAVDAAGLGDGVTVAVLDTGLNVGVFQEKFPDKKLTVHDVLGLEGGMNDTEGHGTHVAGTVAEGTPSQVEVMAIKVGDGRTLYDSDIIDGIYYAMENGADVLNMSFGGYYNFENEGEMVAWEYEQEIFEKVREAGVISVAAAGNEAEEGNGIAYPASYDSVVSVAAVDSRMRHASYSNYNQYVDFAAPGSGVYSLSNERAGDAVTLVGMNGTSMATPHMAAVVAVLKSFNADLGLAEVIELLRSVAVDLGDAGRDDYFGWGMVDFGGVGFCDERSCDKYGVFVAEVEVQDMTKGAADISIKGDVLSVSAERACVVVGVKDGEYARVAGTEAHEFDVAGYDGVYVALKGDVDMNGEVNSLDSAMINYSLPSVTGDRHRDITDALMLIMADVDRNDEINSFDSSAINYSLPSVAGKRHKELNW